MFRRASFTVFVAKMFVSDEVALERLQRQHTQGAPSASGQTQDCNG